jgi:hypothetical protein
MRPLLLVPVVAIIGGSSVMLAQSAPRPSSVLARAREAIGIRSGGVQLRSVRMEGTLLNSQIVGQDQRAGVVRSTTHEWPLVVHGVPPDRYLRTWDMGPSLRRDGVDGGHAVMASRRTRPVMAPWDIREASDAVGAMQLRRLGFARFALGVFARADIIPETTIRDRGTNAVEIDAANGAYRFVATLVVNTTTQLPERLVWRSRMRVIPPNTVFGKIGESDGGAGPVDSGETPELDVTMTFADHRTVSGFKLPSRITTRASGVVLDEMRFTTIEVNPAATDDDNP